MRWLVGFICALAMLLIGCSETAATGGSSGSAGTGGIHGDGGTGGVAGGTGGDGGTGGVAGAGGFGGTGGVAGTGGIGGDGGNGGMPECETPEDCDDKNECTKDVCNLTNGVCEYPGVPDGTPCGRETPFGNQSGGCFGGSCNFRPVSVTVGAKEVVFDWTTDRCGERDIPDNPARVVRAEDGELVLFTMIDSPNNYVRRGPDFDSFVTDCAPALQEAKLPTPESYENNEWLWSPYRDRTTWHVLIHNEFHPVGPPPCDGINCWYNSITYGVSVDDAHSFVKPGAPGHTVAPAPKLWTPPPPDAPSQPWYAKGYFEPSNIVLGPGNYYYAFFRALDWESDTWGACLMRTKTLGDPSSWRAWDGTGFNLVLSSPYVTGTATEACDFLQMPDGKLMDTISSLTYNTYLDRYTAVSLWLDFVDGEVVCGVYFSLSVDLIHWTHIQLITKALGWCETDPTTAGLLETVPIGYPSIIDHADSTTNFERTGQTPYLYYTRFNEGYWLDRDLVRVPLRFTLEE